MNKNVCCVIIGLLGLSLLTLGIISFIFVPMIIKNYVFDALMDLMHEDTEQYANFVSKHFVWRLPPCNILNILIFSFDI